MPTVPVPTPLPDAPAMHRTASPKARRVLITVVGGLSIGVLTSFGQTVLDGPLSALANSASAWLVLPWVLGALMATRRGAIAAGLGGCLLQVVGYYVTADLRGFTSLASGLDPWIVFWTLCALAGGPLFGAAGHHWRTADARGRGLGSAVLASAFLAEGFWVYHHTLGYEGTALLWYALGACCAGGLARRPSDVRWLLLTLPAALLAEVAVTALASQPL